jgi:predicted transcriptional regulator
LSKKDPFALKYTWIRDANGKRKRVPVGVDLAVERGLATCQTSLVKENEDQIVTLYLEGSKIKDIANKIGVSPSAIYNYKTKDKRFSDRMDTARASRGFVFEDKVVEVAEEVKGYSSEEVAAARLKVDAYKWAAGVNNPDVHGSKTKVIGGGAPTVLIIDTGFREEPIEVPAGPALPVEDA